MRLIVSRYSFLVVLGSFFFLIFLGALLFMIPGSVINTSISCIDAFFLSVSAVTGTGITAIPISLLSSFGKILLIFLMYVGSIGILTILLGIIFYFSFYSIEWYGLATEILDIISVQAISSFFKVMFCATLIMQFFGTFSIMALSHWLECPLSFIDAIFISINCFCNVGFNINESVPPIMINHELFYLIMIALIVVGSSGFLFLFEVTEYMKQRLKKKVYTFSLTSRLMIKVYFTSVCLFWIFYFCFCENAVSFHSLIRSLFAAVSFRACGISPYVTLPSSIIFISALYGIMGTGPLGTGGGIKSSILGIVMYTFLFFFDKKNNVIIYMKRISWELVAFSHIFLFYIMSTAAFLSIIIDFYYSHNVNFILVYADIIGLITGGGTLWTQLIPQMSVIEKLLCIFIMCIGKIATIGLSLYVTKLKKSDVRYPEAKLIII